MTGVSVVIIRYLAVLVRGRGDQARERIVGGARRELRSRSAAGDGIGKGVVGGGGIDPGFLLAAIQISFNEISEEIVVTVFGDGSAGRHGVRVGGDGGGVSARGEGAAVGRVVVLRNSQWARRVDVS